MRNVCFCLLLMAACNSGAPVKYTGELKNDSTTASQNLPASKEPLDLASILSKKEVPVLCYHHIRNINPRESESMKSYSVTPQAFAAQMKILHDSGYQTVLPNQLYNHLLFDAPLPSRPVMITFDDTREEQYRIGAKEMSKYGFKGVYFIMTIAIDRPRYMTKENIKELSDGGHVIASHTWDHHMVTKYEGGAWDTQLVKTKIQLEGITGKPVKYFAYPFGLWNQRAIPEIKSRGYDLAFILSTQRDSAEPLYTVRRMIVPGTWSASGMLKAMHTTFNKKE